MALFSRRARDTGTEKTSRSEDTTDSAASEGGDVTSTETPDPATSTTPGPDGPADDWEQDAEATHVEGGPFDVDADDVPEEDRIDLTGLQVPSIDGMELRLEVDQRTRAVTGANLVLDGSSLQIQAFAAPTSRGLWAEVRKTLRASISEQGGTAESREGTFGPELVCRLPVRRADGRTTYRPARFIGVDGPRWFLRAILSGPAVGDLEASKRFEGILSRVVVVRGTDAMAPQELIPLTLPGHRPGLVPTESSPLDPLARGPEITQIG